MQLDHVVFRTFSGPIKTGDHEYVVTCPFHDDTKPSCSANTDKQVFKCHACDAKGSLSKLIAKEMGAEEPLVTWELAFLKEMQVLPDFNSKFFQTRLTNTPAVMAFLQEKRFWSKEVIEKFQIGYDGTRILIPIHNIFGDLVNVRAYRPNAGKSEDKFINLKGFGKARLFNAPALFSRGANAEIIICEGEPDCLALLSAGLDAVSSTSGASFSRFISSTWTSRRFAICYDSDEAGTKGAGKLFESIGGAAKIINIETILNGRGKDITDAFTLGCTVEEFKALVEVSPVTEASSNSGKDTKVREVGEPVSVTLQESGEERFYHKLVKMKVMISGKTLAPYLIPSKVQVVCSLPGLNMCKGCGLAAHGGNATLEFNHLNPGTLELIETSSQNHVGVYKQQLSIPHKCKIFNAEVIEAQNIEEVKVIPVLEYSLDDAEYVMRQVYFVGHGLKPNRTYEMTGLTLPHPKTQQVTCIISDAENLEDSVSSFTITDKLIADLKVFKANLNGEDTGQAERDIQRLREQRN